MMKLTFLGTRGYIEARTRRHYMHSALEIAYYGTSVMIDCGEDWLERIHELRVAAVFVTHSHPDHAFGLKRGAPCPVHATEDAWDKMKAFEIESRKVIDVRKPIVIDGISVEAFPVEHSTRAPAVGYRITAGKAAIFYVPDVVYIRDRADALGGARLYVGDGATITRSMVRKPADALIGHTPVRTQLTWCEKVGVPRAIITHCGSEIVEGDERVLGAKLREMAGERGVDVEIAYDGMEVVLR